MPSLIVNLISKNLKTESLTRTVCGSEYQTKGAVNRKAHLEKSAVVNGCGMADEHTVYAAQHGKACNRLKNFTLRVV